MYIWCKPAATTVFKHTRMWNHDTATLTLHSARNMVVSGQICMRQDDKHFTITGLTFGTLPDGVTAEYHFTDYITYNDGVPYPDIMSSKPTVEVLMNATQTIMVSFRVGVDAPPSVTTIPVTIHTDLKDFSATFCLTIHPVTLPEPKDSVYGLEYFVDPMCYFRPDTPAPKLPVTPFYTHLRYDEAWWQLLGAFARHMKDMRINSLHINIMTLLCDGGSRRTGDARWDLCFDLVDQYIEFFSKKPKNI